MREDERLSRRVVFGTIACEDRAPGTRPTRTTPEPGRLEHHWAQYEADDITALQATKGSTDNPPLLLGVKRALWSRAAKRSENWYRKVVDAADRFVTR